MENYPIYLTKDPQPLVGIIGNIDNEINIHDKLIQTLQLAYDDVELFTNTTENSFPSFIYKSLPIDYNFKEKKLSNEFPSFDGIIKTNWLEKHSAIIPSVIIFVSNFNIDMNQNDWNRKEFNIVEKYSKIKSLVNPRDCKIIFVNIKIGSNTIDKDIIDDRIVTLKKHLNIDNKSFYTFNMNELNIITANIRKVAKVLREYSSFYYFSQCKHIRALEKSMSSNRTQLDMILTARYNFKLGYFNEFQGNKQNSLKYYRVSYGSLVEAIEILDEEWTDQIEAVAEYCNFRICYILLSLSLLRDSLQQFKYHITMFKKAYSLPWKHYKWLSDQYIVFAQLLDKFNVSESLSDTDRSFYYLNAAKSTIKRQTVFENIIDISTKNQFIDQSILSKEYPISVEQLTNLSNFRGMKLIAPKYVGSHPQLLDPIIDQVQPWNENIDSIIRKYYEEQEKSVNYSDIIINLLLTAYKRIDSSALYTSTLISQYLPIYQSSSKVLTNASTSNVWITRRHLYIESMLADQYIKLSNYYYHLKLLINISNVYCFEGWIYLAMPLLLQRLESCIYLGLLEEFLNTALLLYSKGYSIYLDRYKKEQLHRDIFSVLNAASTTATAISPKSINGDKNSWQAPYLPIPIRSEYGSFASQVNDISSPHIPLTMLPNNYIVHLSSVFTPTTRIGSGISISNQNTIQSASLKSKPNNDLNINGKLDNKINKFVSPLIVPITNFPAIYQNHSVWYHKLFDISTKFHSLSIEIGKIVDVTISMTSLFHGLITFHEMIIHFYGSSIRQRFKQDELSGVGDCIGGVIVTSTDSYFNNNDVIIGNLVFKPNQPSIFTFPLLITEEVFQKLNSYNQSIHLNRSIHTIALDSILCVEKIELILSNKIKKINNESNELIDEFNNDLNETHRVILSISTLPDGLARLDPPAYLPTSLINSYANISNNTSLSSNSSSKPITIKEVVLLYDLPRQSFLSIIKPPATISLIYPTAIPNDLPTINLIQGPLQRINLIFYTNDNDFIDGKVFLSSDYNTSIEKDDYLFWYPIINSNNNNLDDIKFYPMNVAPLITSSTSLQPISYFILPNQTSSKYFSISLFLRSELVNNFKVKLKLEYIPKKYLQSTIVKEFDFKINFLNALNLSFRLISHNEAHLGIVRETPISTVVLNDTITVSTTISCLDSLDNNILIKTLDIRTNDNSNNYFHIKGIDNENYSLLIHNDIITLQRGETYITSADLVCFHDEKRENQPNILSTNVAANYDNKKVNIGNIYVDWCLDDNYLCNNVDIPNYLLSKGLKLNITDDMIDNKNSLEPFDWLPQLHINTDKIDDLNEKKYDPLILDTSITRICSMTYTINEVNVVNAPFDLKIDSPSIVYLTEVFQISIIVTNLLWSFERFIFKSDLNENFLIAGGTSISYDISPRGDAKITLSIIPLKCGQIPFPRISLLWERNNIPILDIGSFISPKYLYVKPSSIEVK